jgi:xanthine dehydrogenase accessory factor
VIWERLREALEREERGVLVTVVAGEGAGAKLLVLESGDRVGDESLAPFAEGVEASGAVEAEGRTVLAELVEPPLKLVIFGAVDVAEALCRIARTLGWRTAVVDPRRGLATRERLPSAGEIVVAWPDDLPEGLIDEHTAVVSLVHEERIDVPAVAAALEAGAFYVGALGSTRAQEKRRAALEERGVGGIDRISGPVGLDLGGETPAEIALSIAAEIVQRRRGPRRG